jgi:hypothetical protein
VIPAEVHYIVAGEHKDLAWPPRQLSETWAKVAEFRAFVRGDSNVLLAGRRDLQGPEPHDSTFTPVPLAAEIARFSAALLFGEPVQYEAARGTRPALDYLYDAARVDELLVGAAEAVAAEGFGALRVSLDDAVPGGVALDHVPADAVIFRDRFGRFVEGGVCCFTHEDRDGTRWRLLESHETGSVRRVLFKGTSPRLGNRVPLSSGPERWRALKPRVETGLLDAPTLVKWSNLPGDASDLDGLLPLLDELNVAETVLRQKASLSRPVLAALENLPEEGGGLSWWKGFRFSLDDLTVPGLDPSKYVQVLQAELQAGEHVAYIRHLRSTILESAGYSAASWGGADDGTGGRADSGRALALRQVRTDHARRQKVRLAQRAVSEALGVALALYLGRSLAQPLQPTITLQDPLAAASEAVATAQDTVGGS